MKQSTSASSFELLRNTLGPLALILLCPPTAILFWYTNTELNGSFYNLWKLFLEQGVFQTIYTIWMPLFFGSVTAWKILGIYSAVQLIFMKWMPGKTFLGPLTPQGNTPVYKANGPATFFVTLLLFYISAYPLHLFSPTIIYDHFGELLGALNIFSLFFCAFLLFKGTFYPSSTDSGSSGNVVFDYYWGTELYPRIFGWDIKMFTNCRFGLLGWALIILSFAAKQQELYGLSDSMIVAVTLQLLYIAKFFFWETGYLSSLDIMHDRAGYYICWGCLVWVPGIYTSSTLYLVNHPNHLGVVWASLCLGLGALCIMINYFADRQRQRVRVTQGDCKIWGKNPLLIPASYVTEKGDKKNSLLLASGWWGISRHFHYVPEILGALFWTLPALFENFSPYFYVLFLTILLVDRAFRDDLRCSTKYKEDWNRYCQKVPYKIIPFVI